MQKFIAMVLIGLSSSAVMADSGNGRVPNNPEPSAAPPRFELKCRFEGCRPGEFKDPEEGKIECRVEARFRAITASASTLAPVVPNELEVRCSNDFELRSRDAAIGFSNRTLWINGDSDHNDGDRKIATLRVEDFLLAGAEGDSNHPREFEAVLLTAKERGERKFGVATRLEGRCRLEPTAIH